MLLYVYGGYLFLLKMVSKLNHQNKSRFSEKQGVLLNCVPEVTIFFSAYNEESNVRSRLKNLVELDYPAEKTEIVMLSDGSTDRTVEIGEQFKGEHPRNNIRIIDFKENAGQARGQNEIAKISKYDILLSTDAETRFPFNLLKEIMQPFCKENVGVVSGVVIYESAGTSIGDSYSKYRTMERDLRNYETSLGSAQEIKSHFSHR